MLSINRNCSVFTRACLVLVYLSFFLVQFNVHFNGASSSVSFFATGYNSQFSQEIQHADLHKIAKKDSASSTIKLNKRFHPRNLFIAPEPAYGFIVCPYSIKTILIRADKPLTEFAFNSPSLRGPPPIV